MPVPAASDGGYISAILHKLPIPSPMTEGSHPSPNSGHTTMGDLLDLGVHAITSPVGFRVIPHPGDPDYPAGVDEEDYRADDVSDFMVDQGVGGAAEKAELYVAVWGDREGTDLIQELRVPLVWS